MRSRISAGVATLALTLLTVGTGVTPASAAPPSTPPQPQKLLKLSWNANGPWADNLDAPLFGQADSPMVPGDGPIKTFYAFNTTGTRANLSLACTISRAGTAGADFANHLQLAYRVNGSSTTAFTSCRGNHEPFVVNGRSSNKVDVQLAFPSSVTNAMRQGASYSITVTLRQIPPGRGGGRPAQVLGTQTLVVGPTTPTTTSGTTSTTGTTSTGSTSSGSGKSTTPGPTTPESKGKSDPVKTSKVAATLPTQGGASDIPLSLIGMLLATGALLAGLRHRRPRPD